jgi:hypothetical protein
MKIRQCSKCPLTNLDPDSRSTRLRPTPDKPVCTNTMCNFGLWTLSEAFQPFRILCRCCLQSECFFLQLLALHQYENDENNQSPSECQL